MRTLIKSLLLGLLVDHGGSLVGALFFGTIAGVVAAARGTAEPSDGQLGIEARVFGIVVGGLFTLLGGYVAVRLAPQSKPLPVGLLFAALTYAVGSLWSVVVSTPPDPAVWVAIGVAETILCAICGALLACRQRFTGHSESASNGSVAA